MVTPAPETTGREWISTGHLPTPEVVDALVLEAHERFRPVSGGHVADYIPSLAAASPSGFGICVAAVSGALFPAGDAAEPFSIQSLSKPFLFALLCEAIGEEEARGKLGVNSTGLPFNSVLAVERSAEGLSNPMVNAGAIAATSLVPGATAGEKWRFIHEGISRFAGRPLPNDTVYFGEISLTGAIRPASQTLLRLKEAQKLGFSSAVLPQSGDLGKTKMTLDLKRLKHLAELTEIAADGDAPGTRRAAGARG